VGWVLDGGMVGYDALGWRVELGAEVLKWAEMHGAPRSGGGEQGRSRLG
jgi:hypothetical protein